jgi:hypothetical protein
MLNVIELCAVAPFYYFAHGSSTVVKIMLLHSKIGVSSPATREKMEKKLSFNLKDFFANILKRN